MAKNPKTNEELLIPLQVDHVDYREMEQGNDKISVKVVHWAPTPMSEEHYDKLREELDNDQLVAVPQKPDE